MKEITVHHVETLPDGNSTLQVIETQGASGESLFYVRLSDGVEHEDTPCEDYPEAQAHWRDVLRKVGITAPYVAPTLQITFEGEQPTRGWVEIFYEMHSRLKLHRPGSDEVTAMLDEFMTRQEFIDHAVDILAGCGDNPDWIHAVIRVACKRVLAKAKINAEEVVRNQLGALPTFGAF